MRLSTRMTQLNKRSLLLLALQRLLKTHADARGPGESTVESQNRNNHFIDIA